MYKAIDKTIRLEQSVERNCSGVRAHLKKALCILGGVAVAVVVFATLVLASGEWQTVGQTPAGDIVSVSAVHGLRSNQRTALVRVQYKDPAELPHGGPFVEMRARVRFNCANGTAAPTTEWFYTRDRSGRIVVGKKATRDDQFGKAPEGGFVSLVSQNVCRESH
jgi:hypothetical protein